MGPRRRMAEAEHTAPLLVIDGDNLAHRAYHAIPKTLLGTGGRPINALVGWTQMLVGIWDAEQPRAVFVAWDSLDTPTYRHALLPTYQGGRVFDEAIVEQLGVMPRLAAAFGFAVGQQPGLEADDLMAAAALSEAEHGGSALVLTTDKDSYQLVSGRVTVLAPRRGGGLVRIGPPEVVQALGVSPEQVPDYKALAGDPSDRIPGAPGVGPKTAAALLQRYGSLERVLEARPDLGAMADLLLGYRDIARMRPAEAQLPLPLASRQPDWKGAAALLEEIGATVAAARLAARA